jgi:hypothetical protein
VSHMPAEPTSPKPTANDAPGNDAPESRSLTPQAQRALAEAAARRAQRDGNNVADQAQELNGRGGLDPTRYGDWEIKGLTSDL